MIVISDDNEGNGYHGMVYDFTEGIEDMIDDIHDSQSTDPAKIIILG